MDKLRLFAVAALTKPPVELSRRREQQMFTCSLNLPLPPQLLIFNQGQWPPGEKDDVILDIFLDSDNIGQMQEDTKCFAWETDSLRDRTAGEKVKLEIRVVGMKTSSDLTEAAKEKKPAPVKKTDKTPETQKQKNVVPEDSDKPLADISEKINTSLKEMSVSPEDPKSLGVGNSGKSSREQMSQANQKTTPTGERGRPGRKKSTTATAASKKKTPTAVTEVKKTRQTQLNFAGFKKVSPLVPEQKKQPDEAESGKTTPESGDTGVEELKIVNPAPSEDLSHSQIKTELMDVDEGDRSEVQVVNETTPQQLADMPSPLPRKPVKQKRLRSDDKDKTPEGPTPKKRGTRMRALTSESGTPKSSRSKIALGDSFSGDNVISPEKDAKKALLSDGRMTKCIDLSARAPSPSARWGHTMLLTRPHCAVLIGGQGDRQQLSRDSVWTLHTETRKWRCQEIQSEGQKPENRMGHTASYDPTMRCVYIFGGSKNSRWFHDVHVYDLDENKWSLAKVDGKAPTRAYHTAILHRHELWIFGGVYPRPDPNPDGCSNDIHIFSPVMQSWYSPLVQGEKPLPRSGHSATLIDDQMVMFGGWDAPFCYNDLFILDMTTVDWSKPDVKGTPPKPRSWHASCALSNQRILIHGGYDGNNALEDSFIFDLRALSWSRLVVPNAPKARAGHAAVRLPYSIENQEEDEVLVFGGGDNDGEFFSDLMSFCIPFNCVVEVE